MLILLRMSRRNHLSLKDVRFKDVMAMEKEKEIKFETITVDKHGKIIGRKTHTALQYSEVLGSGVTLEMVYIHGGTFLMGSPESEEGHNTIENPQHKVTVAPFYMGKFPITQEQWNVIMGTKPSVFEGAKYPVRAISWHDAVELCRELSKRTGRVYSLPGEAQWEYACRARTTTPFHFGETITPKLANYNGNYPYASGPIGAYRKQSVEVGSFHPNAFGLYDMHGNIWEWCADPWHETYKGAPPDGKIWESGGSPHLRVLRGGSWSNLPIVLRSACRLRLGQSVRPGNWGVRLVCPTRGY
jgi:formylglycine-generating enzyme required for sulfatase activity